MNKYSSYILYLLTSVFVVILYANGFGPLENLQQSLDDFLCQVTSKEGIRPNVIKIEIDGRSQDEYGPWPWNQDRIADLLAAAAAGEPKAIAVRFDLSEDATQDSAGYTNILAGQLTWIDNVVLPYDIALATYRSDKTNNTKYLFEHSVTVDNKVGILSENSSLLVRKVFLPAEKLLQSKPKVGFDYVQPDQDRILRHEPTIMNFDGYYYPSLSLLTAATYLGVPASQIEVIEGKEINIGSKVSIPINSKGEFYINFAPQNSFTTISAADVLSEDFNRTRLKDKALLIGPDVFIDRETFTTPVDPSASRLTIDANIIENIINQNFVVPKEKQPLTDMAILFLLGAICAFVLPQVNLSYRMVILFIGFIILANVNYFLISSFSIITNTIYIALELLLFMGVAPILDSSLLSGEEEEETDSDRPLPKINISQEIEKEAPVREIISSPNDQENLHTAAISDSQEIYPDDHQAVNLDVSLEKTSATPSDGLNPNMESTSAQPEIISSKGNSDNISEPDGLDEESIASSESQPLSEIKLSADNAKNLGRYQITGVLGKGAMGLVYKGVDPAINRPVALKTIRLDFVNDPEEMAELKERLFREAQAAGKLSHPNIVTIYDVGSEGHLQYIAMEYLEGQTLEDMIKKKTKFNYRIIAQIIMQICAALQYAHEKGIVHRDIKPANIMVLKDYKVKVMDYGIARIDSNSMTKTGIAMGTPNYISPEQLKGQAVDRRADLFSLGVVMYEMVLGRRPFKGENITSLIYAITTQDPKMPSTINPQIPLLFDHIIGRALKKNPNERYQKASEIAANLSDFVESFSIK